MIIPAWKLYVREVIKTERHLDNPVHFLIPCCTLVFRPKGYKHLSGTLLPGPRLAI